MRCCDKATTATATTSCYTVSSKCSMYFQRVMLEATAHATNTLEITLENAN